MLNAPDASSIRPYLLRAMHEWCTNSGFTPYVMVAVDETVQVPREYVKDREIVLNVSYDATAEMNIGNEFIEFKARFGGVPREIIIPLQRVMAIYARENGQGMTFPLSTTPVRNRPFLSPVENFQADKSTEDGLPPPTTPPTRPTLTRVK